MKFGAKRDREFHTVSGVDTIELSERELWDLQEIPGAGVWAINRHGKETIIRVVAEPDAVRTAHKAIDEVTR
jgi:hypothetical protein